MKPPSQTLLTVVVVAVMLGVSYPVMRHFYDVRDDSRLSDTFYLQIPEQVFALSAREFDTRSYDSFPVFQAKQGDTLELTIHSARAGSIHVHGYEKQIELVPGGDVKLRFDATAAGLFPIHLHGADDKMEHVATFEVHPR